MRYVIIGNSIAAVGAIEAIRKADTEGAITVLSKERYPAYGRPLISYLLGGIVTEKGMNLLPEDFCQRQRVQVLLNSEVVSLDDSANIVRLANGDTLPFDRLLIATGGDPFVPPIEGLAGKEQVFTFTTWDDAARLKAVSADIGKVVVIGGGLIGLKAAEGLHLLGKKVTIVELADRILSAAFDKAAGRIVAKRMNANGIEVITEDTVARVDGEGASVTGVTLASGERIPCDAVIVAIGVRPATGFLKGSRIEVNRGIVVNDRMETSVPGIFAAGDVTEAADFFTGQKNPMPIWPDAHIQGDVAGSNMAGAAKHYQGGLAMNSIEFFKVPTISMGITNPAEGDGFETLIRKDPENNQYRKLVIKENCLVGAVLVGKVDRAGILSGLIREKLDISSIKEQLLEPDFGFVDLGRDLRNALFGLEDRAA